MAVVLSALNGPNINKNTKGPNMHMHEIKLEATQEFREAVTKVLRALPREANTGEIIQIVAAIMLSYKVDRATVGLIANLLEASQAAGFGLEDLIGASVAPTDAPARAAQTGTDAIQ